MASFRLASVSSRSSFRRSSTNGDAFRRLVGPHLQRHGNGAEALLLFGQVLPRRLPGQRLDAPDAGGDAGLADQRDQADLAGASDMRAAAKLHRIGLARHAAGHRAHGDDPHLLAVLLAEQRHRAGLHRLLAVHQVGDHRLVLQEDAVGEVFDRLKLVAVHRFGCEKSNRSRSGATSEPFCATWVPSTLRSAA
jgi:hypothetical protein